ncbi:MAG: Rieske 2Fe-2S domain-containing protein [Chloroflexota bacterium]|nr:Rieske 2Fe-2S domain-containing protein [Chloroflexota bacterium]MDE3102687.1 Rieske 2Fe-2S domain-containing protein [Chloroflexota bacterium]
MIRPQGESSIHAGGLISRLKRRQLLRIGFLGGTALAVGEIAGVFLPFFHVNKIVGLGAKVPAGKKADVLSQFKATFSTAQGPKTDHPILFVEGKFFLIHPPNAIAAAYRKCVHLGCAVPFVDSEDRFHCPCHGSLYDKNTVIVLGGPAPRPLDLFNIAEQGGNLIVDTNPLKLLVRSENKWDPAYDQVSDSA